MSSPDPRGDLVTGPPAQPPDLNTHLKISNPELTNSITLVPLDKSHAKDLFTNLGGPQNDHLYTWLPDGPLHTIESLIAQIDFLQQSSVFFPYVILSRDPVHLSNQGQQSPPDSQSEGTPVGIICLMNIVPNHRSIEIGHVLFGSTLQKTTAATEACYLLMEYAFKSGFLRVEWKTNVRNSGSRRAALRLGFVEEGIFRKHMVVKGRRRDTIWYSVVDDEWFGTDFEDGPRSVRQALEAWLSKDNFDAEGGQKRKLESFRER